jgi:hypothetical protein
MFSGLQHLNAADVVSSLQLDIISNGIVKKWLQIFW